MTDGPGIYSIGAVSRMLGISQPAIRSWEDRYGLIVAERSEGGRRIYTRAQLAQLRFIKDRLDEGLTAADAHRLLAEEPAAPEPIVGPPVSTPSARSLILVADSDRYGAELSRSLLRIEGYDVEIALTAPEAEEKFASYEPVLSIVEVMISGGVGRDLCTRLKQRRATPVLCVSSLDLAAQARAAGADAFLTKPLEPRRLVSTVNDLLGRDAALPDKAGAADE